MKKHQGSRRTSGSSTHPKASAGKTQTEARRLDVLHRLANPPPRVKPEELVAWISSGITANGRDSPITSNAKLSELLLDFELSDTERHQVIATIQRLVEGKRNR